jgi:hypothetical protein
MRDDDEGPGQTRPGDQGAAVGENGVSVARLRPRVGKAEPCAVIGAGANALSGQARLNDGEVLRLPEGAVLEPDGRSALGRALADEAKRAPADVDELAAMRGTTGDGGHATSKGDGETRARTTPARRRENMADTDT